MDLGSPYVFVVGLAGLVAGVVAWALLFAVKGREYVARGVGRFTRDPEEIGLPPALAGYVWRTGHVSVHDLTSTILDLVDRQYLSLESAPGEQDATLILSTRDVLELMPHEREALAIVFAAGERGDPARTELATLRAMVADGTTGSVESPSRSRRRSWRGPTRRACSRPAAMRRRCRAC